MARQPIRRNQSEARLAGEVWAELAEREREEAMALAGREGIRAIRERLGAPHGRPASITELRRSPWAREHAGLAGLPDDVLLLYAAARTIPCPDDYVECVVERLCPERAGVWWGLDHEERQADPRVCAFCDAYERARCPILGVAPPPTAPVDLQLQLWQAKEQERERARDWMRTLETSCGTEAYDETQRAVASFEYQRCQWVTDFAQMMLDLAVPRNPREGERRAA